MADQRLEKWTRWIDGPIKNDVITMHLQRESWRDVAKILEDNGELPDSYWWEFMRDTYAVTQAVAIRRQADRHRDVASLRKLIEQIRDDAGRITRDFWMGLWDQDDPVLLRLASRNWAEHYADSRGDHFDGAIAARDLDELLTAASEVTGYVNRYVAHSDASAVPASVTVTLGDVHDVIDVIGSLFKRYYSLLTAESYVDLVPVIQHDWKAVFREPWIRPHEQDRRWMP